MLPTEMPRWVRQVNDQLWQMGESSILFSRLGYSIVFKPKLSGSA